MTDAFTTRCSRCGFQRDTPNHVHGCPPVSPGISEERLTEIEATLLDGKGPAPPTFPWVNGAIDALSELLAEVRRLRQQVERVKALDSAPLKPEDVDDHLDFTAARCGYNEAIGRVRRALGSSHG